MSRLNKFNFAVLAVIALFVIIPFLTACGNDGPVNPDFTDIEGVNNDNPFTPPGNDGDEPLCDGPDDFGDTEPDPVIGIYDPSENEASTESMMQFLEVLNYLKDSDGGVLSHTLGPDELAIHVWDRVTGYELPGEVIINCLDGPTSLFEIHGIGMFEHVTFPVTVTVKVPGYALETCVLTDANVLSYAMTRFDPKPPAWVFGVFETYGADEMTLYDDNLVTGIFSETPSAINSDFFQFEIQVAAEESFGFSGFLNGKVNYGDMFPDPPYQFSPLFFMANHFAWDFEPLTPGDHMFYSFYIESIEGPDGFETSTVIMPDTLMDPENYGATDLNRALVLPTAIKLDGYQYLAMGPHAILEGPEPDTLFTNWHWWDTSFNYDRTVLAGQLIMEDGSINIVHMDWHPDGEAPEITFSGASNIGITGGTGGGLTFPTFTMTDPISEATDIIRITASGDGIIPLWNITSGSGIETLNTSEFSIPAIWLQEIFIYGEIMYQAEYTDALSMTINDFTNHQIVMTRRETCYSPWQIPTM